MSLLKAPKPDVWEWMVTVIRQDVETDVEFFETERDARAVGEKYARAKGSAVFVSRITLTKENRK